jgi:hypothetical protein
MSGRTVTTPRALWWATVVVAIAGLGLLGTACRSGGHRTAAEDRASTTESSPAPMPPSTSTTSAATAPSAAATTTAAVEEAYQNAIGVLVDYESKTGPFDAAEFKALMSPFITGSFYESSFKVAQQMRLRGEVFRPAGVQPGEHVITAKVTGSGTAEVRDCEGDHGRYRASDGQRLDRPGGRVLVVARMVLEDARWKIESVTDTGEPCAV